MKKLVAIILILLLIGMIGSCWFNQRESNSGAIIEPRSVENGDPVVLYPDGQRGGSSASTDQNQSNGEVPNNSTDHHDTAVPIHKSDKYISTLTKVKLLFDAPGDAHFMISNDKELLSDKTIQVDMDGDHKIETVTLGLDHPNGVRVNAVKNGVAVNLMSKVVEDDFFDDYGDLIPGNSIQVTVLDIDQLVGKEIVISVGKYGKRIKTYLFYVDKKQGFNYIGAFESKSTTKLVGNSITASNLNGKKETYAIYQRNLMQVIK